MSTKKEQEVSEANHQQTPEPQIKENIWGHEDISNIVQGIVVLWLLSPVENRQ